MPLRVYNTLTRQKEDFQTVRPGKVGMYVCGPTVYKPSHVGHMVGPVIFDTVKRYLTYLGYEVTWVVNITDVDDKLIKRAKETGTTVQALAEKMTADYLDCLKKLNVTGIDRMPKATEHIPEMIGIMQGLIEKGYAYAAGGDVYFDISKDHDYGKLCNRDPEQLEAGSRIEVSEKKRNPGDFALWKGAKQGEPAWVSPWGLGRPGWHIECSAMSMKYLGETFDIHGGGLDLQFPHHENELAQSESFTHKAFALYWMHNGLLKMGHAKMAGSVGNVVNVVDLLKQHSPETVRFLLLNTQYRSPIEWTDKRLAEMERSLEGFYNFFRQYQRITGESFYEIKMPWTRRSEFKADWTVGSDWDQVVGLRQKVLESMDDDFNTGGAVGALHELLTALNRYAHVTQLEGVGAEIQPIKLIFKKCVVVLREVTRILGLFWEPRPDVAAKMSWFQETSQPIPDKPQPHGTTIAEPLPPGDVSVASLTPRRSLSSEQISQTGQNPSLALLAAEQKKMTEALMKIFIDVQPDSSPSVTSDKPPKELVEILIDVRTRARKSKNFALGDQIRKRLGDIGIALEDRPGGKTEWRVV